MVRIDLKKNVYLFQTLKSRVSQIVTTFVIFDRNNLRSYASLQHQNQLYKLTNYTWNDYQKLNNLDKKKMFLTSLDPKTTIFKQL